MTFFFVITQPFLGHYLGGGKTQIFESIFIFEKKKSLFFERIKPNPSLRLLLFWKIFFNNNNNPNHKIIILLI